MPTVHVHPTANIEKMNKSARSIPKIRTFTFTVLYTKQDLRTLNTRSFFSLATAQKQRKEKKSYLFQMFFYEFKSETEKKRRQQTGSLQVNEKKKSIFTLTDVKN